jgi:hypothetical protein
VPPFFSLGGDILFQNGFGGGLQNLSSGAASRMKQMSSPI